MDKQPTFEQLLDLTSKNAYEFGPKPQKVPMDQQVSAKAPPPAPPSYGALRTPTLGWFGLGRR